MILAQAKEWNVCPFEMGLDVASWCDAVLCDYNYAFDPKAHLRRFFGEGKKGDYIFLVDEAHNLVDRAREMYSAGIVKEDVLAAKKIVKNVSRSAARALERLNRELLAVKKELLLVDGRNPYLVLTDSTVQGRIQNEALRAFGELQILFREQRDGGRSVNCRSCSGSREMPLSGKSFWISILRYLISFPLSRGWMMTTWFMRTLTRKNISP